MNAQHVITMIARHVVIVIQCQMMGSHALVSTFVYFKLEALEERRPPWPRQIITPILPNVKMMSIGGERLTPKLLDHYLYHDLVMLPLLLCFLLIYAS